jgi:chromosome segregation ATPase
MSTPQEKMQAFRSAQKFGKQYPGLIEALQEWATIGSLDQAAEESKWRLDAMRAEEQALRDALDAKAADAETAVRKTTAESERELAHRRAVATALVEEANLEARCILDTARVQAAELVREAERQAVEHQAMLASAKQDLAGIAERIESKTDELSSVSAAVEQLHAQHERFTHLIAQLTAKF